MFEKIDDLLKNLMNIGLLQKEKLKDLEMNFYQSFTYNSKCNEEKGGIYSHTTRNSLVLRRAQEGVTIDKKNH